MGPLLDFVGFVTRGATCGEASETLKRPLTCPLRESDAWGSTVPLIDHESKVRGEERADGGLDAAARPRCRRPCQWQSSKKKKQECKSTYGTYGTYENKNQAHMKKKTRMHKHILKQECISTCEKKNA